MSLSGKGQRSFFNSSNVPTYGSAPPSTTYVASSNAANKENTTTKKRDSYSHYTRSANHNFQNQNIDRGRSGDIYYRENDEEYDSREAFYDDIELDPLED